MFRSRSGSLLLFIFVLVLTLGCPLGCVHAQDVRPNFIIIVSDDQRHDTMRYMPRTSRLVFEQGATFRNAFATTPLCNPSRASILTGLYARNHGARRNLDQLQLSTIIERFNEAGYFTGIVGKYLNYWEGSAPPGAAYYAVSSFGGADYKNPTLTTPAGTAKRSGYITDLLRDEALSFVQAAHSQNRPFLLFFTPNAPHAPAIPAQRDKKTLVTVEPYRPRNYGSENGRSKPSWTRRYRRDGVTDAERLDHFRLKQLRSLQSLDRAIGDLVEAVDERGLRDNTVILYTSDNGFLWGEFGLTGKEAVYEPSVRVPFGLRFPKLVVAGTQRSEQVANIDIAPTLYEWAGVAAPYSLDGRSLAPLVSEATGTWSRDGILLEAWHRQRTERTQYRAVHDLQYAYVVNDTGEEELYDLVEDPLELLNRAANPLYSAALQRMREKLTQLEYTASLQSHSS